MRFLAAHLTPAPPADQRTGLLGYVRVEFDDHVLDGLTLRKTLEGQVRISFPARTDRHGNRHAYVKDKGGLEVYLPHPDHKAFVALIKPLLAEVHVFDYTASK